VSPSAVVDLLDKQSQQELVHSANIELRSTERRGLLWLLDEECVFPGATDESFVERLFVHYSTEASDQSQQLLCKSAGARQFVLRHQLGTAPVLYDTSDWLRQAQQSPVGRHVLPLLQQSDR
jgi:myosin-18